MSGHSLFGVLAVKLGRATREEVEAAAQEQTRLKEAGAPAKRIGDILKERGVLRDGDILEILSFQGSVELASEDTLFGELAVANGFLNVTQLSACLKRQVEDEHAQRIGEILVERGFLNPHQREALLFMQARLREAFGD